MSEKQYTILIVDDERTIRERIVSKINKHQKFIVAGEAENGVDALDFLEKRAVDVVLTDIKMPFIDGIALTKQIRSEYPKIKIAFISGYNEFEYAKAAIKLNVISYLSKPVTDEEINQCLKKMEKALDEEYQMVYNRERLENIYQKYLPALVENQFNLLLSDTDITDEKLLQFQAFNINLTTGQFLTGIVEFDHHQDFLQIEKLKIFVINLMKRKFYEYDDLYYFNTGFGLVFIVKNDSIDVTDMIVILHDLIAMKNEFSKIKIRIGISEIFHDFKQFPNYILQARKVLSYSNYLNIDDVMYYKDITTRKKATIQLSKDEIIEISHTLKFKSLEDIHQLFKRLMDNQNLHQGYLLNKQYYIINLVNIFVEFAEALHVNLNELLDKQLFEKLNRLDQLKDIFQYLEQLALKIRNKNCESSKSKVNQILQSAISYLENHYDDSSLNMDMVCDQLGISVSYLSILFKKEQETTFNKYLINIRINKAKELLKYSNLKIVEIAQRIGYNDVYYFSYSFKKNTGCSPREYRKNEKA